MTAVVLRGDAAHLPLPDGSVDLIVTSPPYFGQRQYTDDGKPLEGQIGAEKTPTEYIAAMLDCTREWVRVLKPEGSIFVVLDDKYCGYTNGQGKGRSLSGGERGSAMVPDGPVSAPNVYGIPNKSLMLLPERYRIGCVDRLGLIAREVIEWSKVNGTPESVEDRCRSSREDVVHLTKQPRYFSAVDEIREPHQPQSIARTKRSRFAPDLTQVGIGSPNTLNPAGACHPLGKLPGNVWEIPTAPLVVPDRIAHARCCGGRKRGGCEGLGHHAAFPPALPSKIILGWSPSGICLECGDGRFPVATATALDMSRPQARRAHQLATAAGLTEDHLLALLSVGISDTGRGAATQDGTGHNAAGVYVLAAEARAALGGYAREYLLRRPTELQYACACTPWHWEQRRRPDGTSRRVRVYDIDGWEPAPTRPAIVVDPFAGTGTTMLAASVLGRIGVGVDRSMDYCRLARWRTRDPAERARALGVPKPPPVPEGQRSLFDEDESVALSPHNLPSPFPQHRGMGCRASHTQGVTGVNS